MKGKFGQLCFIPKIWKPTPNVQCHWKDGKHQESHLYSDIKISLPKHTSSPEVFIKCRKEVLVLLGLSFTPEAFFFPYPNTSKGICCTIHHIPGWFLSLLPAPCRSKHEVFLKATAVRACTKHPEFCFLPDNFYCISKLTSPKVHQPVFPPDSMSQSFVFMLGSPTDLLGLCWFILITQIRNKVWKKEISA